jgi:hypothetical protein
MRAESLQWRAPASLKPFVAAWAITGVRKKSLCAHFVMTHARRFSAAMVHVLPAVAVPDDGRFVASSSSARSPIAATVAGFSIATTASLSAGILYCNSAPSCVSAESSCRIPSTNTLAFAAAAVAVLFVSSCLGVAFSVELTDLDWGSWEGSLPDSSSLGGDRTPLRGAFSIDPTSSSRDSRTHWRGKLYQPFGRGETFSAVESRRPGPFWSAKMAYSFTATGSCATMRCTEQGFFVGFVYTLQPNSAWPRTDPGLCARKTPVQAEFGVPSPSSPNSSIGWERKPRR